MAPTDRSNYQANVITSRMIMHMRTDVEWMKTGPLRMRLTILNNLICQLKHYNINDIIIQL